jgi:hypothetical protein
MLSQGWPAACTILSGAENKKRAVSPALTRIALCAVSALLKIAAERLTQNLRGQTLQAEGRHTGCLGQVALLWVMRQ